MTMSRRKTLALLGGGLVLAAGTGVGLRATRSPDAALAPWAQAGQYSEPRMRALSYAILAPNPHNRQPWQVDVSVPNEVTLYVDTNRLLPHTDPFSRQITIGLGCFLEVMRMAALADGYAVEIETFPEGSDAEALDARPVARCVFRPTEANRDPLFDHVLTRNSLKEPYDLTRPVNPDALDTLGAAVEHLRFGGTVSEADLPFWRDLTREALFIELKTPHTLQESVDLFRIGAKEINAQPDGIDFSGPFFELGNLSGVFTREKAATPGTTAYEGGFDYITQNTDSAMGMIWIVSPDNSRDSQIAAGRDWVRLNLATTALGLGTQPMSQPLQEYPEMAALYKTVHDRLAPDGGTVQMLARIGYGPQMPPSPRWNIDAKVLNA